VPDSDRKLLACEACGAKVTALRRGRCPICYLRWTEARPVGLGACCVICGERRRDHLRSVEFQQRWLPMCHDCAARMFRFQPLPRTIEAARQRLSRDRRWQQRRAGRRDNRIFPGERRVDDRRQGGRYGDYIDASDLVIEVVEEEIGGDATNIVRVSDDESLRFDRPLFND
jgi:hypothetical protein